MRPEKLPASGEYDALVGRTMVAWAVFGRRNRARTQRNEGLEDDVYSDTTRARNCRRGILGGVRTWSGDKSPCVCSVLSFTSSSCPFLLAMEEENEQLDWGNEDDELQHQDLHRKSSAADFDRGELGDVDDAEDSVSLGDDEDEQGYYAYQQQDPNGGTDVLSYRDANPKSVSTPKSATFPTSQQNPQEHKRESSTTSQKHSSTAGSPSRHQQAANQHTSPGPRSQAISTRMTHALPPKPVVTNVPFLHPSHPSIVEATAMSRTVGRSESNKNKTNGASATISTSAGSGKPGSSGVVDPESLPLLPNWEVRHPRNGSRGVYYYNVETHESTWSRPVSSSNSTLSLKEPRGSSARRRRASSVSVTGRPPSPLRSDHSVDPSLRSVRAPPLPQLEFDVTDPQESSQLENTLSLAGLSYEDRHYRPAGGDGIPAAPDARRGDVDLPDPRFNPNPRTAFTPPVSPRVREHPRSLSPVPHVPPQQRGRDLRSRGSQRSARGARNANTNAEPSMQKDHDARPAPSISPGRHWIPAPRPLPVEHATNASQGSRRQQRHQGPYKPDVDPTFELSAFQDSDRPTTRTGGVRSRNRDRDQPRVDSRERQNQSQSMPAPSTLSASSHHPPPLHPSCPCTATLVLPRWRALLCLVEVAHCAIGFPIPYPYPCPRPLSTPSPLLDSRTLIMDSICLFPISLPFQIM